MAIFIVLLILGIVVYIFIRHKLKRLNLDAITLINGGVKTGKTTLAVHLAIKKYRSNVFKWRIKALFQKLIHKPVSEKPLLYSNIKLSHIDYVPLTEDIISRRTRMNYKSVVLLSEVSLVIDSMHYKDNELNERVTLFVKLFGHETRGGSMFIETQCINDMHFGFRRNLNKYIWIYSLKKWIPFILVFKVREMMYNDADNNVSNTFNEDIEESTKWVICTKRAWKKFDCYTYSSFTDNLECDNNYINYSGNDLKADSIVSFVNYKTIKRKEVDKNESEKN